MTLAEIMTSSFRGEDVAKMQLIEEFDGHGGQYVVCHDTDVDWQQTGQRFRDLRTAAPMPPWAAPRTCTLLA